MEHKYNVTVFLNNEDGEAMTLKGTVGFSKNKNDYGNGYYMGVEGLGEPFNIQSYDIRYDLDFNEDEMLLYIVRFYHERFKSSNRWSMAGIRVHEAE